MDEKFAEEVATFLQKMLNCSAQKSNIKQIWWASLTEPEGPDSKYLVVVEVEGLNSAIEVQGKIAENFGKRNGIRIPKYLGCLWVYRVRHIPQIGEDHPELYADCWDLHIHATPISPIFQEPEKLGELPFEEEHILSLADSANEMGIALDDFLCQRFRESSLEVRHYVNRNSTRDQAQVVIYGFESVSAAQELLSSLLSRLRTCNLLALLDLAQMRAPEKLGWRGEYAVLVGRD